MRQKLEKDGLGRFLTLCSKMESPEDLKKLFDLFFTIEEKETMGKRLLIVKALQEKKLTQREIADELQVSISQITRGSNALKIIDPSLRRTLAKLL